MEIHGLKQDHTCTICGKKFHLKWRLLKHEKMHTLNISTQFCHFYNNNKDCPYHEVGCMFKHEEASECTTKNCTWTLCEFKHSNRQLENDNIETLEDDMTDEDQVGCFFCRCTFLNQKKLDYHIENYHFKSQ